MQKIAEEVADCSFCVAALIPAFTVEHISTDHTDMMSYGVYICQNRPWLVRVIFPRRLHFWLAAMTSREITPSDFHLIVVGTGLQESLLAA